MRRRNADLSGKVAIRTVQDALSECLIDRRWDEVKEFFERPDVKDAEAESGGSSC